MKLSVKHEDVDAAIEYVMMKRKENERWILDNAPGPLDSSFGVKGKESKWITLRVLRILN